jgi:short subunit dehydrogenase-like uncharacterized protein
MASRIVLFGATGYTGDLAARALVKRGLRPLLAGRSANRLSKLAAELGGLEYALADVTDPATVAALVGKGDVLVSTVGPFGRYGQAALAAVVAKGAHYLDSNGEPPFIHDVFETWGPKARAAGSGLMTAMAYEYVPGNLAAAFALQDAGPGATRVEVGYFVAGPVSPKGLSGGTLASLTGALFENGYVRRGGVMVPERAGLRYRRFRVGGKDRPGLTLGASEHYALPQSYPKLQDVETFLGWFGPATPAVSLLSRTGGRVVARPPVRNIVNAGLNRLFRGSSGGPDLAARARFRTMVVAEAKDANGRRLGRAVIEGTSPYEFTGEFLAWAAERTANVGINGVGALGPVSAFGLPALADGAKQSGLERTE